MGAFGQKYSRQRVNLVIPRDKQLRYQEVHRNYILGRLVLLLHRDLHTVHRHVTHPQGELGRSV